MTQSVTCSVVPTAPLGRYPSAAHPLTSHLLCLCTHWGVVPWLPSGRPVSGTSSLPRHLPVKVVVERQSTLHSLFSLPSSSLPDVSFLHPWARGPVVRTEDRDGVAVGVLVSLWNAQVYRVESRYRSWSVPVVLDSGSRDVSRVAEWVSLGGCQVK